MRYKEETWHITDFQQWVSVFIVLLILVLVAGGLIIMWLDLRKAQSVQQWTDDFICDSGLTDEAVREHLLALRAHRP